MNFYSDLPATRKSLAATGPRRHGLIWFIKLVLPVLIGLAAPGTVTVSNAADTMVSNAVTGSRVVSSSTDGLSAAGTNAFNVLDDKYKLVIGDQLSFWIVEDKEVEGHDTPVNLAVTDSGDVQVPYIGRYPAVGKTCKELSLALKQALEMDYYKRATVIVAVDSKPRSRGKIYLVGAIGAPGPQDVPSDETLTLGKAILRAGGLTSFAKGTAVQVTRSVGPAPGVETKIIVNVTKILEDGRTDLDLTLQPGDLIFVPERMIRF